MSEDSEILTIGGDDPDEIKVEPPSSAELEVHFPVDANGDVMTQPAGDVEYDVVLPGGGKEIVPAGQLSGALDTVALAQRRLLQMQTLRMLLSKAKQNRKNAEAQVTRTVKSRKKRDLQKASRKKNRGR